MVMERCPSAQSRVEEYMRVESRLSEVNKPPPEDDESKASYCWRLIRQSVRQATDLVKRADSRDLTVTHGVHHNRRIRHPYAVTHMLHNKNNKTYISLDGRMIRVFETDGRKKDVISPPGPFQRLLYASQVNLYVGWTAGEDKLYLMTDEFELQSVSSAPGPIQGAVYNEQIGEVLTLGNDFLTSWVFRYGGRHILPRKTSRDGFKSDDEQFSIMVLEETASQAQKLYCCVGTSVLVFNVFDGKLLMRKSEVHVRTITAMLHFNPLKYLITAARDGSIKVWDDNWHLQLVFVGHGDLVTSLAVYPYGPNILSASRDNTIRVWSLETCDQVDQIPVDEPVQEIGTQLNHDNFYTYCQSGVDLWKVKHVHYLHTRISHGVVMMKVTDHPLFPVRVALLCKDSSVRIMSPSSGDIITTLLMKANRRLVDAAYAIAEDTLFAVFGDGTIVKSATSTNPCTVLDEWPCENISKACNYLLVYEYVITSSVASDTWGGVRRATIVGGIPATGTPPNGHRKPGRSANRTLLLGGRKDGYICVYHWDTGNIEFEIEAHGNKGVMNMIANSKADQLISAGLDNIIKIWRLYPYAQESLTPLMSFYCAHSPVHMTVLKTTLTVAFQEPSTATYSTVMYDLRTKNRRDHGPGDDHTDCITGLSTCHKMKILASCSLDGTLRIWNDANVLIRVIKLNATPHSMTFCTDKGDLLLGIGEHVHKIDPKLYMPGPYRLKMVSMQFHETPKDEPLPLDETLLLAMSRDDVKRLKAARSSFKFTHFVDILTEDENEERTREKKIREKAFAALDARDMELNKIRNGDLSAATKPKSTPVTKREAFDKYLSIFYNRGTHKLPDEDLYPEDTVTEKLDGPTKTDMSEGFKPEREPTGFFPSPASAMPSFLASVAAQNSTLQGPADTNISLTAPKATTPAAPQKPASPAEPQLATPADAQPTITGEPESTTPAPESKTPESLQPKPPAEPKPITPTASKSTPSTTKTNPSATKRTPPAPPVPQSPAIAVRPGGYVPNSVLVRVLWPQAVLEAAEKEKTESDVYRPPQISEAQLAQIASIQQTKKKTKKPKRVASAPKKGFDAVGTFYDRELVMDYDDDEDAGSARGRGEVNADGSERGSVPSTATQPSSFLSKMQSIMDKPPTPRESPEPESRSTTLGGGTQDAISRHGTQNVTDDSIKSGDSAKSKKIVFKPKLANKFLGRPLAPPPKSYQSSVERDTKSSPVTRHSPSPPPPPTPLPGFITQFKGVQWFDQYFPNCNENTLPKPWSPQAFAIMLARLLRITSYPEKAEVAEAILAIHDSEGLGGVAEPLSAAIYGVLHHAVNAPSCSDPHQKAFIRTALTLLERLGLRDKQFYTELIMQFLEGDREIRSLVEELLTSCGLKDSNNYFRKELDGWDVWNIDEGNRPNELRKMAGEWLDRWMTGFKLHIEDTIERLKKGQNVKSRSTPSQLRAQKKNTKQTRMSAVSEDEELDSEGGRMHTMTMNEAPDADAVNGAGYMEAINYFCEMELEKYLDRVREGGEGAGKGQKQDGGGHKNTVLVLPKIAGKATLVRLGETHTSKCRASRETSLAAELRLPAIMTRGSLVAGHRGDPGQIYGFPSSINLPMKSVVMDPFSTGDVYDREPLLLMLKTAQKYFVPGQSYIQQDN